MTSAANERRYFADDLKGREGAVFGPEANGGEGGTILYVCDGVGEGPGDEAAQLALAKRVADALNFYEELTERLSGAAAAFCEMHCPSTWKGGGPQPHIAACRELLAACRARGGR